MVHRLSKFLLPVTCACALVSVALPATAAAKLTVGLSDQNSAVFRQPLVQKINITVSRYITPWNTATDRNRTDLNNARAFINASLAAHVTPMVSFGGTTAGSGLPRNVAQYKSSVAKFMKDFPKVRTYAAWNEPDWIYRPQLANNPTLAAAYFNALHQLCSRCTDVAGEVYLPTTRTKYTGRWTLGPWLRIYAHGLHYHPSAWALHNYYDIRSHKTSQVQVLQSIVHSGQIWLTEIAGIERRGHWQYRNQSVAAAARDEAFLFALPKRFHRITRIYHYDWYGTNASANTGWDSGLINPNGTVRPAYNVVAKAAGLRHTVRHGRVRHARHR